jgi:hypothetical protein
MRSVGAQICGQTRRIIYCLDTRHGPQNGGFWTPPEMGGFWGGTANSISAHVRNRCFLHTRKTRVFDTPGNR